jgi:hypothetical protein
VVALLKVSSRFWLLSDQVSSPKPRINANAHVLFYRWCIQARAIPT